MKHVESKAKRRNLPYFGAYWLTSKFLLLIFCCAMAHSGPQPHCASALEAISQHDFRWRSHNHYDNRAEARALELEANEVYAIAYVRAEEMGMLTPERKKALEEMGTVFTEVPGHPGKYKITEVTPNEFSRLWDAHLERVKATHPSITENDVLRPAIVYEKDGVIMWFRPGTPPPPGATPVTRLLSSEIYAKMAEEGYSPLGRATGTTFPGQSFAQRHDRFHKDGFARHPECMKAARHGIVANGKVLAKLDKEIAELTRSIDESIDLHEKKSLVETLKKKTERRKNLNMRMINTNEGMILVKKGAPVDLNLPPAYRLAGGGKSDLDSLAIYLGGKSDRAVKEEYERIKRSLFSWVDPVGGEVSDVPSALSHLDNHYYADLKKKFPDTYLSGEDVHLFSLFKKAQGLFEFPHDSWSPDKLGHMQRQALARVKVALAYMKDVTGEEWLRYASLDHVDTNSPVYKLFCLSGVWTEQNSRHVWHSYCQH